MEDDGIELFAKSVKMIAAECARKGEDGHKGPLPAAIPRRSFADLGLDPWLLEVFSSIFLNSPTMVQKSCIPEIMEGKSVVAASPTGTGKTIAFAAPILHLLAREPRSNYAIVLTPTRELALQIFEQFQLLGKPIRLRLSLAVGGFDMVEQAKILVDRPHIVVATPGRLLDLIKSNTDLNLRTFKFVVFDEADRLLDKSSTFMKFEIPEILSKLSKDYVPLFFSATITKDVRHFATSGAFFYEGNPEHGTNSSISQYYVLVPSQVRDAYVVSLLQANLKDRSMIIFVGKCITCALLSELLFRLKIKNVCLHGKQTMKDRLRALNRFKSGSIKTLITTDVGSRGLDLPDVEVVLNFDLPVDARDYVHRIGRTGRAGKSGTAISFAYELDMELLLSIEAKIQRKIELYPYAPTDEDILKLLNPVAEAKREASIYVRETKAFSSARNHTNRK